jgi:hypothetical protein
MLLFDDNAELFQEKLEALAKLIMPYKMESEVKTSALLND